MDFQVFLRSRIYSLWVVVFLVFSLGSCQSKKDANSSRAVVGITPTLVNSFEGSKKTFFKSNEFGKGDRATLVSWNIQDLGRTKTAEDIFYMATILRDYDIVCLQEVVAKDQAGAQAVAKIADELNRMGSKWDYRVSDPTKSPSAYISERYAFLWKTSKVSLIHKAYLDTVLEDVCYREPYVAEFRMKGKSTSFYVVNCHSRKYNDKPEDEIIHLIDYPRRLESEPVLIAGDFNLSEKDKVWRPFYDQGFMNAVKNAPTTLKTKCKSGDYLSHSIDNVYFSSQIAMLRSGSIDFVNDCVNLERGREISDHLPVFLEFGVE